MPKPYKQPSLKAERARLGAGLFTLAVRWSQPAVTLTQAQREAAIKATAKRRKTLDGKSAVRYLREQTDLVVERIVAARAARNKVRAGFYGNTAGGRYGRRNPIRLPAGTLPARLVARITGAVTREVQQHYRLNSAGSLMVTVAARGELAAVAQATGKDWDYYSKKTTYPKTTTDTTITVPMDWHLRVKSAGLAVVDGLVTLSLSAPLQGADPGSAVHSAIWLVQGKGYALTAQSGYLAVTTDRQHAYHGATAQSALQGLRRKLVAAVVAREVAQVTNEHLQRLVAAHPTAVVTLADARRTGACEAGISSWCALVGLDYSRGQASAAEIYAAHQRHPSIYARGALLNALRRVRGASLIKITAA